ncbi:4-(cytidine 5'-diphospho)-2-C-methyl-D-erythritol kinase [Falsigemmobacter faecalis]|uniref:4-diphosphocytidyl-2-C-methyl-D-erythritol kinase n=1 Tax=Falsigemmobacter faecalis TaxID=2488730 RepID=A0A3P3DRT6_9RHOB|nr:4-(cytidine 5'-diphospho)-2-C-methyl-D-erythritol kinase [Falsigemmobacter faecalis]RRH76973.1 4-(cytidine 5'-diphospho)-2-C-methyl-D-erythritol kinase [Falsigemmobacter faecalis]
MSRAEFAAAKINLALHVTGQRADGYHLLDSLVSFAGVGDSLRLVTGATAALQITGAEGRGLSPGEDNLVLRAARLCGLPYGQGIELEKRLPLASGIGGGSADAAAALRLLTREAGAVLPSADQILALGADVPVCLSGRSCRMSGVGEILSPFPELPELWAVLVNPRVEVPTPAVFRALKVKDNPSLTLPEGAFSETAAFLDWLAEQRNDLEEPAISLAPEIGTVLDVLWDLPEALFARMSGSGATCFALFACKSDALRAVYKVQGSYPDWWVAAGALGHAAEVSPGA